MDSFPAKATCWVLVATVIGTLPALVFLGCGIVEYQKPPNYALDPDPELIITIPLLLVLLSAVVAFTVASLVALGCWFFGRRGV